MTTYTAHVGTWRRIGEVIAVPFILSFTRFAVRQLGRQ